MVCCEFDKYAWIFVSKFNLGFELGCVIEIYVFFIEIGFQNYHWEKNNVYLWNIYLKKTIEYGPFEI